MTQRPGQGDTIGEASTASVECSDVTALARLSIHISERRIEYLIGTLLAYQLGLLDKLFVVGSGYCG